MPYSISSDEEINAPSHDLCVCVSDVKNLDSEACLAAVLGLRGVTYHYRRSDTGHNLMHAEVKVTNTTTEATEIGVIAQEVERLVPQVCAKHW